MIEFPPDSLAGTIFDEYIKEFSRGRKTGREVLRRGETEGYEVFFIC